MLSDSFKSKFSVKLVLKFACCLFLLLPPAIMSLDAQKFAQNSFLFGAQMYKHLPNSEQNVIYSPFSIQTCLTMAFLSAGGRTAEEMATTLNYLGISNNAISEHFSSLLEAVDKEQGLKIANKIYVKDTYKLKQDFNTQVQKYFRSSIESIEFSNSGPAAKTINSWVEDKTNNRIKDLIKPDALNAFTRAVLVNAIYFKGKWKYPFNPMFTQPMPFWIAPDNSINVDTMNIKKHFKYADLPALDAKALELPYQDSNITMLIILPNQRDGLKALEAKMQDIHLEEITSQMYSQEVEVFLPKFEFEYEVKLNDVLKAMGIKDAFNEGKADFSGMLDTKEQLYISDVVHKAFIKVDEEGAEAAAATGIMIQNMCLVIGGPPPFTVDRPFVGLLRHGPVNLMSFAVKNL